VEHDKREKIVFKQTIERFDRGESKKMRRTHSLAKIIEEEIADTVDVD